jgi:hypothetical protein
MGLPIYCVSSFAVFVEMATGSKPNGLDLGPGHEW